MKPFSALRLSVFLLIADRLLKIAAIKGLVSGSFWFSSYPRFAFHRNFGMAFDIPLPNAMTIFFVTLFLTIILIILVSCKLNNFTRSGFILMSAGAASNLYDRIHYGFVIDMIEIIPASIWNVADMMIVIGLLLVIFYWPTKKIS